MTSYIPPFQIGDLVEIEAGNTLDPRIYMLLSRTLLPQGTAENKSHRHVVIEVSSASVKTLGRSSFSRRTLGANLQRFQTLLSKEQRQLQLRQNESNHLHGRWQALFNSSSRGRGMQPGSGPWNNPVRTAQENFNNSLVIVAATQATCKDIERQIEGLFRIRRWLKPSGTRVCEDDVQAGLYLPDDFVQCTDDTHHTYGYWNSAYVVVTAPGKFNEIKRLKTPAQMLPNSLNKLLLTNEDLKARGEAQEARR